MITITVKLTFDPTQCEDVDADSYDPEVDLQSIFEYGSEYYNLEDWEIVPE